MKKSLKTKFTLGLLCVSIIPVLILFYLHIKSFYKFYDERTSIIASGEMEKAVYQIDSAFPGGGRAGCLSDSQQIR